jgi:hypothetical protein
MPDDIEFLNSNGENDSVFTWVYDPNPQGRDVITPEDLFVWISFRSLPKSRSVIETDGTYSSSFFDSKGIQFISSTTQNGKGYMTTNYTNIGGRQTSEKEAFGITDIEMTYGASLAPKVKMTFVDLRGAGLFNGYEFEDEKGLKYNSSEFSSFFRLPYPIFELSIKGFYGRAVSYCLHLTKWSARFDSSVGNFVIEAEFVGYTFAFLTDILMTYVRAITSTEIGASALEKQNKKRRNIHPNSNEIVPLDEFLISLGKLTIIGDDLKDNSGEYKELIVINTLVALLDKLIKTIGRPVGENVTSVYGSTLPFPQLRINQDQVFVRDVGIIGEGSAQIHDIIVEDVGKFVKEYNDLIKKQRLSFPYLSKYSIQSFDIKTPALAQPINTSFINELNATVLSDGLSQKEQTITADALRSRFNLQDNSNRNFFIIDYHKFRKEVSDLLSDALAKQEELKRVINEALNDKLGQELGFDLKIESILNIILGNVEAFIDVVYNVALEADSPDIQAQRIDRLRNIRTDINQEDQRIYPFPAVFDSDTAEEVWIGDIVGENNPAFPEIRLVKETINALIAVNTKDAKDRIRNNTRNSVNPRPIGWIPVSPLDYDQNALLFLDNWNYSGNEIPDELAVAIVSRALFAYEATGYNDARFNTIAQTEGSYAASQVVNNVIKQVIKNYNNASFVEQVIEKSGFPSKENISELEDADIVEGEPVLIGGFDDVTQSQIDEVLAQPKRVLPKELNDTIATFKNSINDTLIPTKSSRFHRQLDANGLYVYGDVTSSGWSKAVFKNLRKFYKARTSNDLKKTEPLNAPAISVVNDLTVFDGQINNTVDYSKSSNTDEKFVNNARAFIANNLIRGGDVGACLFDTQYYLQSEVESKAYYYLLTIPIDNIDEFYSILSLGGVYKFSRIQFAWLSSQFYRAKYIKDNGFDIFDKTIEDVGASLALGQQNFNLFKKEFEDLRDNTIKYLPNLDNFTEEFVEIIIDYYNLWVEQNYIGDEANLNITPEKKVDSFIGYIADWEQFYNYKPYGLTSPNSTPQVQYGYTGSKPFSQITRDEAVDLYKNTYYKNVEVLPLGLQAVAMDFHVNQGDHIGLVFATATRMGLNTPYDYDEVTDIWFGEGAYPVAQKDIPSPLEYQDTFLYKEYPTYQTEIENLFSQNPTRFLEELTKTRMMRYSRTIGRDTRGGLSGNILFQEWSWRSLGVLQYAKDLAVNNTQNNQYYFGNGSQFVKNGIDLGLALGNASNSEDNETWYTKVRQETEKRLITVSAPSQSESNGLQFNSKLYCELTENGINPNSADYSDYKKAYNKVLAQFVDTIDIVFWNPQKILVQGTQLYQSLGIQTLSEATLRQYITKWIETFKKVVTIKNNNNKTVTEPEQTPSEEQEFYMQDKDFKIATYNHFKNLYDKWIGGNINEQLHNACTIGGGVAPRDSMLIDRFHFIDRSWSYIGEKAVLNPSPIMQLLKQSDVSLYEFLGRVFSESNFDFHVLPSWVNYKNLDGVREMWQPQTDVQNISSGASYICMYMGGTSKVLDIGKKVGYVNDGFDLRSFDTEIPNGFKNRDLPEYIDNLEDNEKFKYNMVVFRVSYADQNQSIFKDISVSQEELGETAESLQALSDAFDNRGGTKRLYKGVNLYNVFALRSYKCTVKSLGNMMIHPLTYFQLDNVPFFHGAYLIEKVSHSITPHYIETTFTGARVPRYIAPIVEFPTTYVNIPLSDTLFKPSELDDAIVRPLTPEDPQSFASDGENSSFKLTGEGIPTAQQFLEAEDEDNVLLTVTYGNTGFEANYYIEPNLTPEIAEQRIAEIYNPNAPITFKGVGLGNCYGWVARSLAELGVLQTPFDFVDAWTFYSGWDDTGTVHITNEQFTANLQNGWTNQSMAEVIPDGSFIACYYSGTEYSFRAIDRMVTTGISNSKVQNLRRLKAVDTKTNPTPSNFFLYKDTTPTSKQRWSLDGYKKRWTNEAQISDYARGLDGKQLPFAPVTHTCIFINGHCFHQTSRVLTAPTPNMRIVAYYPFKDKLLKKLQ